VVERTADQVVAAVMTTTQPPPDPGSGLIPLTRNEIRRLFTAAITPIQQAKHLLQWSIWPSGHVEHLEMRGSTARSRPGTAPADLHDPIASSAGTDHHDPGSVDATDPAQR